MNTRPNRTGLVAALALALAVSLATAGSAHGALHITSSEYGIGTWSAATDDLINLGTPSLLGQTNAGGSLFASDPTGIGLNNGTVYDGHSPASTTGGDTYCPAGGSSITFDLDLTSQPGGYTIGSIASISGGSQNRRSQRFRLEFSSVGNPGFTTLADENQIHFVSNATNGEMRVMISDDAGAPLAAAVDQLRVTYFQPSAPLPDSMYRELDVFGYSAPAGRLPHVSSANLSAHFDASDINGDGGMSDPGNGNDVGTWTDLVSGGTVNHNAPTDGKPNFIAAGSGGIGNQDTVRFQATGSGGDLLFNNALVFNAQTIYAVATMVDNGAILATMIADKNHDSSIRQTTTAVPSYYPGNVDDFIAGNGVFSINGNPTFDIPGGFGAAHVVKAVRNSPATYNGFRFGDNIVADRRWNGDVAEVIAFDGPLDGNDSVHVNKYLIDKYGINQVIDERLADTTQVADDPFGDNSPFHLGVNFHYGSTTAGTLHGIGFDNIDLSGGAPPTGPFALTANPDPATLTLNFPFTSDNTPRSQSVGATGPDAGTLDTVGGQMFYVGGGNHPLASMIFSDLDANDEVYVQVIGGDGGWNGDLAVEANGSLVGEWTTVADGSTTTASLFGFFATTDNLGRLQLDFTISAGNYAGIGGIIITQQVPEPATAVLCILGGLGMVVLARRRRRRK